MLHAVINVCGINSANFCSCRKYKQSDFLQLLCNAFVNRCNLYSITVDTVQVANTMVKPYKVNKVNNVINGLVEAHAALVD